MENQQRDGVITASVIARLTLDLLGSLIRISVGLPGKFLTLFSARLPLNL